MPYYCHEFENVMTSLSLYTMNTVLPLHETLVHTLASIQTGLHAFCAVGDLPNTLSVFMKM